MDTITDYSPNIKWGKQIIEVTLQQWKYRKVVTVRVGGNCRGFDVIEAAIGNVYDSLFEDGHDEAEIRLESPDGNALLCEDEEDNGEDWLKEMIVSIRIIGYEPPTLNEVRERNGAGPVEGGDKPYVTP